MNQEEFGIWSELIDQSEREIDTGWPYDDGEGREVDLPKHMIPLEEEL